MEKINALPHRRISEVEDFVDFIASRTDELPDEEKDQMIARYAAEFGGTEFDLDENLMEAGLDAIAERDEVTN